MRRLVITFSTAVLVLSISPAGALARHGHRRHDRRLHHARIERFGRDITSTPSGSSSADNAGTVQSFQNGVLTIVLGNGSSVSGAVTGDTEIECMAPETDQTVQGDGDGGSGDQSGDGDNSGSGDNGGSGDNQGQSSGDQSSGDDQGDAADQNENQAEDQNETDAAEDNGNEAENHCAPMNLTLHTVVREAELRVSGAGAVWKKLELAS